jgi:hypothetical protein
LRLASSSLKKGSSNTVTASSNEMVRNCAEDSDGRVAARASADRKQHVTARMRRQRQPPQAANRIESSPALELPDEFLEKFGAELKEVTKETQGRSWHN